MLIDLTDVLQVEGKTWETTARLDMEHFSSRQGTFPISSKSAVSLRFTNEGKRKLRMEGSVAVKLMVPCDRCLKDVEVPLEIRFEEELEPDVTPGERALALDEQVYLEGYNLDVDKLVYGEILMNWPAKVLCIEDCKGICLNCGADLNLGPCGCDTTAYDPRMAKIQEIFKNNSR